ncbi:hypothetical protein HYV22_03400 [Candidatus Gottesmanbacteria bacterium]|nr:hypothetical protein [Candidatus Gottesmanbacteria bacterium]
MTPDDIRQQIELNVVEMIKEKLADGTMTDERSQQISQTVLDTLVPGMSFEQLYKAIPKIDDTFPELSPIILPILKEYETNITQQVKQNVENLIKQGQFDAAAKLAQKAVDQEVKLVWQGKGKV